MGEAAHLSNGRFANYELRYEKMPKELLFLKETLVMDIGLQTLVQIFSLSKWKFVISSCTQ